MPGMMPGLVAEPVPLDAVPHGLLRHVPFQSGAAWWRSVIEAAMPPGAAPHLLLAHAAGRPAGMLALCMPANQGREPLAGLVTPYTCLFQPVLSPDTDAAALGRAFGRACAAWPVLRLDALDADWPGWRPLLAGFAGAGWRGTWFDAFGNWHADASGGMEAYLAARPGELRETIRRKLRRVERDATISFTIARDPVDAASRTHRIPGGASRQLETARAISRLRRAFRRRGGGGRRSAHRRAAPWR